LGKENYIGFYIIKVAGKGFIWSLVYFEYKYLSYLSISSKEINELVAKRKAREEDIIKAGEHQQWMAKGNEDVLKDIYMQPGSYIVVPCTKYPDVGMGPFRFL